MLRNFRTCRVFLLLLVTFGLITIGSVGTEARPRISREERQLCQIVESFYEPYRNAPNELKKAALRAQRRDELSKLLRSRKVSEWGGVLREMGTNSDGHAYVVISVGDSESIAVGTWNNGISDMTDHTLILNGSKLYNKLAEHAEGSDVTFSGTFFPSEKDYIEEKSITEYGSMTAPEFLMNFTDITAN